jgi:hypothetical protein
LVQEFEHPVAGVGRAVLPVEQTDGGIVIVIGIELCLEFLLF